MQGVGIALQVLPVNELFELALLAVQAAFQVARLSAQILQRRLQAGALSTQLVQVTLGDGDFTLGILQLVDDISTRSFGCRHVLAQGLDLPAQILEVALLLGDFRGGGGWGFLCFGGEGWLR